MNIFGILHGSRNAKDVITGTRAFFERKAKNGDRSGTVFRGRASCTEKKMCHVMRRGAETRMTGAVATRRGEGKDGEEGRQRADASKSREKEAAAPCAPLLSSRLAF